MGVFSRLRDIVNSNITGKTDQVDDYGNGGHPGRDQGLGRLRYGD